MLPVAANKAVELTFSSPPAATVWFPLTCVLSLASVRGLPPFPLVSVAVTVSAPYGMFGANATFAQTPIAQASSVKYSFESSSAGHGPLRVTPPGMSLGAWPEGGAPAVGQLLM